MTEWEEDRRREGGRREGGGRQGGREKKLPEGRITRERREH